MLGEIMKISKGTTHFRPPIQQSFPFFSLMHLENTTVVLGNKFTKINLWKSLACTKSMKTSYANTRGKAISKLGKFSVFSNQLISYDSLLPELMGRECTGSITNDTSSGIGVQVKYTVRAPAVASQTPMSLMADRQQR